MGHKLSWKEVRAGIESRNPKAGSEAEIKRKATYWFAFRFTFNYLLIELRSNYIPGGDTTHSEINLPPSIATEKKNAHRHRQGPV